jgi:hypothetical protein
MLTLATALKAPYLRLSSATGHAEYLKRMKGNYTYMTDVSIFVPVITAAAAILGAAISPVTTVFQSSRQARQERQETAGRQACIELLRAAVDLRALVANNHDYHGDEMAARLAQVRQYAADARVHAFNIALLAPKRLADSAADLAAATGRVAVAAAENTDLSMGVRASSGLRQARRVYRRLYRTGA